MDTASSSAAAAAEAEASASTYAYKTARWLPCVYVIVLDDRGGGYIIAQTSPETGFTIVHIDGGTGVLRQWPRPGKQYSSLVDAEIEIGFPGLLTSSRIQVEQAL